MYLKKTSKKCDLQSTQVNGAASARFSDPNSIFPVTVLRPTSLPQNPDAYDCAIT